MNLSNVAYLPGTVNYLFREDFESGTQGVWTVGGTNNFGLSNNPIQGKFSLQISQLSFADRQLSTTFTEWDMYLQFKITAIPSPTQNGVINFQTSATTTHFAVFFGPAGAVGIQHGTSTQVNAVGTFTANTIYDTWTYYKAGSGANGIGSFEFQTDGIRRGKGNNFINTTTGNSTAAVDTIDLENTENQTELCIYDKIRLSNQAGLIGNFPR
jgi:hypothetical protein